MKRQGLIRQLLEALRPYQAERIYLFGSWARGEEDELSDLDVVVIKRTDQPFLERLREVGRLLPADLGAVDVFVYTPGEFAAMLANGNAFAEMVVEEGRLIYDQQAQD
ncbi:MAG: nucleotidyltransferase domain-containing protein [Deltaproteobacteria bacterium]|nr:nucleotidyltransferase domain-containing protein [Deltaproteobacteria bacterium]